MNDFIELWLVNDSRGTIVLNKKHIIYVIANFSNFTYTDILLITGNTLTVNETIDSVRNKLL